jgi:hypothetical protein
MREPGVCDGDVAIERAPTLRMPSLAVRFGMKRSAALHAMRVLVGRARIAASAIRAANL